MYKYLGFWIAIISLPDKPVIITYLKKFYAFHFGVNLPIAQLHQKCMYIEDILTPRKVNTSSFTFRTSRAFWWITFGESGCQEMVPELPASSFAQPLAGGTLSSLSVGHQQDRSISKVTKKSEVVFVGALWPIFPRCLPLILRYPLYFLRLPCDSFRVSRLQPIDIVQRSTDW